MNTNKLNQTLVRLAAVANSPQFDQAKSDLPETWKALSSGTHAVAGVGTIQYLLSYGNVDDDVISCMSVGMPWSQVLGAYDQGFETTNVAVLPTEVTGTDDATATVFKLYADAYSTQVRTMLWNAFDQLPDESGATYPLYITGMGMGGPLAQITSLDLRADNTGPDNQSPPQTTNPPCHVFSTGNISSSSFATNYAAKVPDTSFSITIGTASFPIDLFSSRPDSESGFFSLGQADCVLSPDPYYYLDPWEVRDFNFYIKMLGGQPEAFPVLPPGISSKPSGFRQDLALSFGKLNALTYQQAIQPYTIGYPNCSPYTVSQGTLYNGNTLIALFYSFPGHLVVSFRGTITFQEFLEFECLTTESKTPYDKVITKGAYKVCYEADTAPTPQVLATQIRAQIKAAIGSSSIPVFLTGHGFGGIIANVIAADLAFADAADVVPISGIYTYGCNRWAGSQLVTTFNTTYAGKSFQIQRASDKIANASISNQFNQVNDIVSLNGTVKYPGNTHHELNDYIDLLQPIIK